MRRGVLAESRSSPPLPLTARARKNASARPRLSLSPVLRFLKRKCQATDTVSDALLSIHSPEFETPRLKLGGHSYHLIASLDQFGTATASHSPSSSIGYDDKGGAADN